MKLLLGAVVVSVILGAEAIPTVAHGAGRLRVAVLVADRFGVTSPQGVTRDNFGNTAASDLMALLSSAGRVDLVEAALIDRNEAAIRKSLGEGMSDETRKEVGMLLSADYFLTPRVEYLKDRVTEEEYDVERDRTRRITKDVAKATVYIDMTEIATGIKRTVSGMATETEEDRAGRAEALRDKAIKKAVGEAAQALYVERTIEAAIINVEPDPSDGRGRRKLVTVNKGTGAGIQLGQKFEVVRSKGKVMDPTTGKELSLPETKVGSVSIQEEGTETSMANTKDEVVAGDILRAVLRIQFVGSESSGLTKGLIKEIFARPRTRAR